MSKEIERKFLVTDTSYRALATGKAEIVQGYLSRVPERTVRVRLWNDEAFLTVKTRNVGITRNEWEYRIPAADAREMLKACEGLLEKTRYIVPAGDGLKWEVDEFHGRHEGLTVAEIELPAEDCGFTKAGFVGEEVTGDPRYYNSNL